MNDVNKEINEKLISLSDEAYKKFQQPLISTVSSELIVGVRTPVLRQFAREFGKTPYVSQFLTSLPHSTYDANNLHAFLIEQIKDFNSCISALDIFLPYVDNWATCDMMSPKILATQPDDLLSHIDRWISSHNTYEIRFAIISLMRHYLDVNFSDEVLLKVERIKSDEYYVNMARAWFFATALAKRWENTIPIIKENRLDRFTHNKTIQKALESYRIMKEQKILLQQMKRR